MGSEHQLEAILFGCIESFFVRPDFSGGEILEFRKSEKTLA